MRLRKIEEMRIRAALDTEYETPREAAHAIFNLVAELLGQRNSYVIGVKFLLTDTMTLTFGPFWEKTSANRFGGKMKAMGLHPFLANSYRPSAPLEPEPSPYCEKCAHPVAVHNIGENGKPGNCLRKGCGPCAHRSGPRRRTS